MELNAIKMQSALGLEIIRNFPVQVPVLPNNFGSNSYSISCGVCSYIETADTENIKHACMCSRRNWATHSYRHMQTLYLNSSLFEL